MTGLSKAGCRNVAQIFQSLFAEMHPSDDRMEFTSDADQSRVRITRKLKDGSVICGNISWHHDAVERTDPASVIRSALDVFSRLRAEEQRRKGPADGLETVQD